ncbi:MAG: hypothetical protein QUU85_18545 [Candidatus Eisenbacteria bacterium]|nr:hypothetical protein [Candidatus Eisenbacteria bacterium]
MDAIEIVGGKRLSGEIPISGAKNAALPMMTASLLLSGETRIRNVPHLRDIVTMLELLRLLGVEGGYEDHSLLSLIHI